MALASYLAIVAGSPGLTVPERNVLAERRQAWIVNPECGPPTAEEFRDVAGVDCLNKPGRAAHHRLGLWTSTWLGPGRLSAWADWCGGEESAGPDYQVWLLTPAADVQVWEIDTHEDLRRLLDRYGVEGEMFRVLGTHGMFPEMDFDRFVDDGYVGIHLTDEGQWRTRGMSTGPKEPNLYGWDCESTLWCRWAFSDVEDLGVLTWSGGADMTESDSAASAAEGGDR